jgi:excisionase family DNA binding protein
MTVLLNTLQAAAQLGLHPDTLRAWRKQGRGPAYLKLGTRYRYTQQAMEDFLEASDGRL